MCRFLIVVFLCEMFRPAVSQSEDVKRLDLMGFLPMTGTGWTGGGACLPAIMMAVRHVNERAGLLDGYNLTYHWVDTQCNAGLATYMMFEYLRQPPTKIMLLGCGCSGESEVTAQVSHLFNITQLSYASSSPILSDRKRFPNFFRLTGPDQQLNPAKVAMMKKFNWNKVATINQALELFSLVIDNFVRSAKESNITIISQEIFEHDPTSRVENLKTHDARIIMTACYEDKARLILCHAFKIGLYGPKIVWFFYGWYSSEFWRTNLQDIPCTEDEMEQAADGAFFFGYYYRNEQNEKGIAGLTEEEFENLYKQEETYDPTKYMFEFISGQCYDHIWVAAIALNCTDTYLKDNAYPKGLEDFTYQDAEINDVIRSCVSNISMVGIIGSIHFEEGADPIKNVRVERVEDGRRTIVGTYLMDIFPRRFEWSNEGIKWKGDHIPRDSTLIITEEESIPFSLYLAMSLLSAMGIAVAVIFCIFNISYRNHKIVKLSSPNINSILLVGCILTYSTVFMKTTNLDKPGICKAKIWCFALGFTIAFGALFSKTWRVYKIFTNKKLAKVAIQDYQLIGIVCAMIAIVVCILIFWDVISPQQLKRLSSEVFTTGNDSEVHRYFRVCYSPIGMYFEWTIYVIEGALLCFGAFLSFETRHVKIEALNDSHQIGMCIYNVVVLSAVGLTLTFLLEEQVVRMYAVISGCVVFGTTATQMLIFMPKVVAVYRSTEASPDNYQPNGSERHTIDQSEISTTTFSSVASPKEEDSLYVTKGGLRILTGQN